MQLSNEVAITQVITPTAGAAGTTDIEGSEIDMANFEGVMFLITFGAITGSAVTSVKAQQDTATGMASAADLEGTSQAVADTDDGDTFVIDVFRPLERFVRCYVDRATQNAVVANALAIQYGGRVKPTTNGSTVNKELHVSPAEGTA